MGGETNSLDPVLVLQGLRLAAGPQGHVVVAMPLLYETAEIMLVSPGRASGLVDSVLLTGLPGLGAYVPGTVAP
jgi:hypothetical protein